MDLLISFVNQTFTPEYVLGILRQNGEFKWIKGKACHISKGITGITQNKKFIYVAFQENGLGVLDKSLNLIQHYKSENIIDPHSIAIYKNNLYVVSTGKNSVYKFELGSDGIIKNETLYWIVPNVGTDYDYTHLNSLVVSDRGKFVTLFGERKKGQNWTEVKNGKLINIESNEIILDNLYHPHSLFINEESELILCESKTGSIIKEDGQILTQLDGYIRGLQKYANKYIVAINARRKLSKSTIGDLKGRIREFEEDGVSRSELLFLSSRKMKLIKRLNMSHLGNEIYDIRALQENSINFNSNNLENSDLEPRSKVLEDKLVEVLIKGEEKFAEINALVKNKSEELEQLNKKLEENKQKNNGSHQTNPTLVENSTKHEPTRRREVDKTDKNPPNKDLKTTNDSTISAFRKIITDEISRNLREQMNELKGQNHELKSKVELLKHDLQKSEIQFHQKSFEYKVILNEIEALKNNNKTLGLEINQLTNEKLELFNNKLEEEKQTIKQQYEIKLLEDRLDTVNSDKSRLKQKVNIIKEKLEKINSKNSELTTKYEDTLKYVKTLVEQNKNLKELKTENQDLQKLIDNLNNELGSISLKIEEEKTKSKEIKNALLEKESALRDIQIDSQSKIESLENQKNEISKKYEDTLKYVASLKNKNNELTDITSSQQLELKSTIKELNKYQSLNNSLKTEFKNEKEKFFRAIQTEKTNHKIELSSLNKKLKKRKKERQYLDKNLSAANQKIESFTSQIVNLKKYKKKYLKNKKDNKSLSDQLEALNEKLVNATKQNLEILSKIDDYKSTANRLNRLLKQKNADNQLLIDKVNHIKKERETLKKLLKESQKKEFEVQTKAKNDQEFFKNKLSEQTVKYESLNTAYNESLQKAKKYINEISILQNKLQVKSSNITSLENELNLANKKVKLKSEDFNNLKNSHIQLQEKFNVLKHISEYDSEFNHALIENYRNKQDDLSRVNSELSELNNKYEEFKTKSEIHKSQLEQEISSLNAEYHKIKKKFDSTTLKFHENQIILENNMHELNTKITHISLLEKQLLDIRNSYSFRFGFKSIHLIKILLGWTPFIKRKINQD